MINIVYYANLLLGKEAGLILKFFGSKEFESLNSAQFFFKNQNDFILSWIKNEEIRAQVSKLAILFSERLDEQQLSFQEKKEMVLTKSTSSSALFGFLEPKGGRTVTCKCPRCGNNGTNKWDAWIPDKGSAKFVVCNHRTNCGFSGDLIAVYAEHYGLGYGQAMAHLSDELGIDFS